MRYASLRKLFYTAALAGTAFSLPVSVWLLSLFTILTFFAWILNGGFKRVTLLAGEKKSILIFFAIYLVYIIWMVNTSDIRTGITELRLKLPLLLFPLVTGLSSPLEEKELRIIIISFISGVIVSSAYGVFAGAGLVFSGLADPRTLSPLISHIRLALMAVFGIFSSTWYFLHLPAGNRWKFFFAISGIWMFIYLFLLLSVTGILVFLIILIVSAYLYIYRSGSILIKILFPLLILFTLFVPVFFIYSEIRSFYKPGNSYSMPPDSVTAMGNKYTNNISGKDIENGNKVWVYLCEDELRREWDKRSSISYDSPDKAGQELRFTLIRYMTSAGLKKDSAGMAMLARADIENVERGMTNRSFSVWSPWKKKVYEIIWQIDYYRHGGNPSRHSVTQRLEFLKTGWQIFLSSPLVGVGTGDIGSAYSSQYTKNNSMLEPGFRLLCHNQFLTFLISFGVIGTVIICFALFYPFIKARGYRNYLAGVFFLIIILSMLGEDTFETHTGITFFAYFYSVFIFGMEGYEKSDLTEGDAKPDKRG
jgi:O-antigen ligase